MTKSFKVTAVISAYYADDLIAARIDNLKNQTLVPEIVMVCQRGSRESEFREMVDCCIYTDDVPGLYTAWNKGIKFSTGEYITNANCDDELVPDAIEKMALMLDTVPHFDLVYGNHINTRTGDEVRRPSYSLDQIRRHCFIGPFPMWRRSLHERYGYFDESFLIAGDWEFWNRIAERNNIYHMNRAVGFYCDRPESLEKRLPVLGATEREIILEKYAD